MHKKRLRKKGKKPSWLHEERLRWVTNDENLYSAQMLSGLSDDAFVKKHRVWIDSVRHGSS